MRVTPAEIFNHLVHIKVEFDVSRNAALKEFVANSGLQFEFDNDDAANAFVDLYSEKQQQISRLLESVSITKTEQTITITDGKVFAGTILDRLDSVLFFPNDSKIIVDFPNPKKSYKEQLNDIFDNQNLCIHTFSLQQLRQKIPLLNKPSLHLFNWINSEGQLTTTPVEKEINTSLAKFKAMYTAGCIIISYSQLQEGIAPNKSDNGQSGHQLQQLFTANNIPTTIIRPHRDPQDFTLRDAEIQDLKKFLTFSNGAWHANGTVGVIITGHHGHDDESISGEYMLSNALIRWNNQQICRYIHHHFSKLDIAGLHLVSCHASEIADRFFGVSNKVYSSLEEFPRISSESKPERVAHFLQTMLSGLHQPKTIAGLTAITVKFSYSIAMSTFKPMIICLHFENEQQSNQAVKMLIKSTNQEYDYSIQENMLIISSISNNTSLLEILATHSHLAFSDDTPVHFQMPSSNTDNNQQLLNSMMLGTCQFVTHTLSYKEVNRDNLLHKSLTDIHTHISGKPTLTAEHSANKPAQTDTSRTATREATPKHDLAIPQAQPRQSADTSPTKEMDFVEQFTTAMASISSAHRTPSSSSTTREMFDEDEDEMDSPIASTSNIHQTRSLLPTTKEILADFTATLEKAKQSLASTNYRAILDDLNNHELYRKLAPPYKTERYAACDYGPQSKLSGLISDQLNPKSFRYIAFCFGADNLIDTIASVDATATKIGFRDFTAEQSLTQDFIIKTIDPKANFSLVKFISSLITLDYHLREGNPAHNRKDLKGKLHVLSASLDRLDIFHDYTYYTKNPDYSDDTNYSILHHITMYYHEHVKHAGNHDQDSIFKFIIKHLIKTGILHPTDNVFQIIDEFKFKFDAKDTKPFESIFWHSLINFKLNDTADKYELLCKNTPLLIIHNGYSHSLDIMYQKAMNDFSTKMIPIATGDNARAIEIARFQWLLNQNNKMGSKTELEKTNYFGINLLDTITALRSTADKNLRAEVLEDVFKYHCEQTRTRLPISITTKNTYLQIIKYYDKSVAEIINRILDRYSKVQESDIGILRSQWTSLTLFRSHPDSDYLENPNGSDECIRQRSDRGNN